MLLVQRQTLQKGEQRRKSWSDVTLPLTAFVHMLPRGKERLCVCVTWGGRETLEKGVSSQIAGGASGKTRKGRARGPMKRKGKTDGRGGMVKQRGNADGFVVHLQLFFFVFFIFSYACRPTRGTPGFTVHSRDTAAFWKSAQPVCVALRRREDD